MSRIRCKNTKPEIMVRSCLHKRGYRFRVNVKNLPGHPDIVLPKYRTVIFIHGCFWHMHGCEYSQIPKTRTEWWRKKLENNKHRDEIVFHSLQNNGWRIVVIWGCAIKKVKASLRDTKLDEIALLLSKFILSGKDNFVIDFEGSYTIIEKRCCDE